MRAIIIYQLGLRKILTVIRALINQFAAEIEPR